jgi:citrate lyase alpha subunit
MKFKNGDRVQFHSTSDTELDSITGKIVGVTAIDAHAAHYIVLLDTKYSTYPWDAISITEHCLKGIYNV